MRDKKRDDKRRATRFGPKDVTLLLSLVVQWRHDAIIPENGTGGNGNERTGRGEMVVVQGIEFYANYFKLRHITII